MKITEERHSHRRFFEVFVYAGYDNSSHLTKTISGIMRAAHARCDVTGHGSSENTESLMIDYFEDFFRVTLAIYVALRYQ